MAVVTEQKKTHAYASGDTAVQATQSSGVPRLLWVVLAIAVLAAVATAVVVWWSPLTQFYALLRDQEAFSAYLQGFGVLGPAVLALMQLLQVLIAFIPGHVFLIAAGYIYGFPAGLAMNIAFTVLASQLCYMLARSAGRPIVNRLVDADKVDYWERVANQKGVTFFTVAFLLPVFPSDMMNFVGGLSGISGRRFLLASFLGRLPSAIMLTLIGSHGLEMSNQGWLSIAVVGVIAFFVGRFAVDRLTASARLPQPE